MSKTRSATPRTTPRETAEAAREIELLEAVLTELRAIRARLERMELDDAIARGVRWAIGGRVINDKPEQ